MNILQYEALVKTLEYGTLSRAAEEMGYTQSGLSRMINGLEEQLNITLLERDRAGVRLTPEGEVVMPYIMDVLNAQKSLEEVVGQINGQQMGLIRIGTFNSASSQWLPGMIREFTEDHPDVRFELVHGTDEETATLTESGRLDLTFTDYPTKYDLQEDFLLSDPIVCIFASDDPYAKRKSIRLEELKNLPYVALNEGVDDEITRILAVNKIELNARFVESDDHAVVAMVEQGLGTSLMSEMMLQGFNAEVTQVPLDPPAYRKLGIACRDKERLSLAASAFMEHVKRWVAARYPEERQVPLGL